MFLKQVLDLQITTGLRILYGKFRAVLLSNLDVLSRALYFTFDCLVDIHGKLTNKLINCSYTTKEF